MQHNRRLSALLLVIALGAGACGAQGETLGEASDSSFHVTPIAGTSLSKVTLSAAGYQRVGIVMSPVSVATGTRATGLTMVPDSAVWYDAVGRTWVYVMKGARTFVREPVVVTGYHGALAVLSKGPAVGTSVVKVGAAELYGAEQGVPGE